jgi:L,D-peptidoglycan transpeptidase YkuD (ErfK/YbiS/YcfS/YnhG family)
MKLSILLVCLLSLASLDAKAAARAGTEGTDALGRSTQIVVVRTADWNNVEGRLQRYERATTSDAWRPVGKAISIVVGRNGLGWGMGVVATEDSKIRAASDPVKHEGDGRSPAGVFALGSAFGYAAAPLRGLKMPYLALTPSIECVDDPGSQHYNRIVDRSGTTVDWKSSEHMRDAGESYVWGVVVDHNATVEGDGDTPTPGGGSCVFLHIWHSHDEGTAGCTAMPESDLDTVLTWLDPARTPLLVQLPEAAYERVADRWRLPKPKGIDRQ